VTYDKLVELEVLTQNNDRKTAKRHAEIRQELETSDVDDLVLSNFLYEVSSEMATEVHEAKWAIQRNRVGMNKVAISKLLELAEMAGSYYMAFVEADNSQIAKQKVGQFIEAENNFWSQANDRVEAALTQTADEIHGSCR
jgi:aspartyl-tRNA synthetase